MYKLITLEDSVTIFVIRVSLHTYVLNMYPCTWNETVLYIENSSTINDLKNKLLHFIIDASNINLRGVVNMTTYVYTYH